MNAALYRKPPDDRPETFHKRRHSPTLPQLQYHRPLRLNFCVRDGNRCFPQRMYTAKARQKAADANRDGRLDAEESANMMTDFARELGIFPAARPNRTAP